MKTPVENEMRLTVATSEASFVAVFRRSYGQQCHWPSEAKTLGEAEYAASLWTLIDAGRPLRTKATGRVYLLVTTCNPETGLPRYRLYHVSDYGGVEPAFARQVSDRSLAFYDVAFGRVQERIADAA